MSSENEENDFERSVNLYDSRRHSLIAHPLPHPLEFARPDYSKSRWDRLSNKYNDQYLEVFNAAWTPNDPDQYLETSQIGAVIWTSDEKARLFEALDRKGRHDLPALAGIVETKSPAEIRDYIIRIEEARNDRQRFSRNIKSATQPDLEAATEIDADLEERLEENADALAAFQDHYNYSEARGRNHVFWLIDSALATSLSDSGGEGDIDGNATNDDAFLLNFFKFDMMLELSRALFMNMANKSEHHHWFDCAEPDEEPSLTLEAARDLYHTVKSLTMKILQTAIFLAESRLRSTATADYAPARTLKDSDISAATEVLNMAPNSLNYWYKFLERSGLKIVVGSHRRGRQTASVTLEQAQLLLSSARKNEDHISLSNVLDNSPPQSSPHPEASDSEDPTESSEEISDVETDSDQSEASLSGIENEEAPANTRLEALKGHAGWRKRRAMIEAAEDDFMELQDHQASMLECQSLRARLNFPSDEADIKLEDLRRPKKLRKLTEDLADWADAVYIAPWEETKIPSHDDFDAIEESPLEAT